jgi:hypothetical protein
MTHLTRSWRIVPVNSLAKCCSYDINLCYIHVLLIFSVIHFSHSPAPCHNGHNLDTSLLSASLANNSFLMLSGIDSNLSFSSQHISSEASYYLPAYRVDFERRLKLCQNKSLFRVQLSPCFFLPITTLSKCKFSIFFCSCDKCILSQVPSLHHILLEEHIPHLIHYQHDNTVLCQRIFKIHNIMSF